MFHCTRQDKEMRITPRACITNPLCLELPSQGAERVLRGESGADW